MSADSAATAGVAPRRRIPGAAVAAERARPLLGLALIAALLPARANWGADLALIALSFTVPGVLLLRALRIPERTVRDFPVYVVAGSLIVMLAAGLACDLIAPHLGVPHPLHGPATAEATITLSLMLWVAGWSGPGAARLPWAECLRQPSLLIWLLVPALSALGALTLSDDHSAVTARVAIFVDLAVFVASLCGADRLGRRHLVMMIFCCALATEWSWSLRGQGIVGFDISTEYYIAQHTQSLGVWHALHRNDAYGAMISVGILPSLLTSLTGLSILISFKALFPVFAALLPVVIFLLGERFLSRRFAVVAAGLMLSQSYFFQLMPELARQEVALVCFASLLAVLLDSGIERRRGCALAALLSLGLVVSHYSSTYLAIPLIVVATLTRLAIGRYRRVAAVSVTWLVTVVVMIAGSVLWYGTITKSANNVSSFVSTLDHQGLNLLPKRGGLIDTYLNGNNVKTVGLASLQRAAIAQYHRQAPYIHPLPQAGQAQYALTPATVATTPARVPAISDLVTVFVAVFNQLLLILATVGTVAMMVRRRSSGMVGIIGILGFGALAFLLFIRFSGTAASEYNESRALAQSLILLALPAAWAVQRLAALSPRRLGRCVFPLATIALGLMFAQQSGALEVLIGGSTSLNIASRGDDYQRYYVTPGELAGARFATTKASRSILYADRYGQLRIFSVSGRPVLTSVTPQTLDQYGWVYGTRTNVQLGTARAQVNNDFGTYAWPASFLNRFYNVVYDDGDSKVYHG